MANVKTRAVPMPTAGESQPILDRCLGCAGEHLYRVFDGERTNFLCGSCSRCWHVGMGWVHRVDPHTCPGCEWHSTCLSRWD